jgi:hypothetical protein
MRPLHDPTPHLPPAPPFAPPRAGRWLALSASLCLLLPAVLPGSLAGQVPWWWQSPAVREQGSDSVFQIGPNPNVAVWIPTPSALGLMGYPSWAVNVVPNGALNGYQRFWIPSLSPTPGSVVYPHAFHVHEPLPGVVPATTAVVSRGIHVTLAELRGWIRKPSCGDPQDYVYALEIDTDWALQQGIDLNRILRVGNLISEGLPATGGGEKTVTLPVVKIELDSWGRWDRLPGGAQQPPDWTATDVPCCRTLTFPWHPLALSGAPDQEITPIPDETVSDRGPYVRVAGALVTDWNHCDAGDVTCSDWSPGVDYRDASHFYRWTEVHPVDLIQKLPALDARVTTRGVALLAVAGTCQGLETDLAPDTPRPPNSKVAWSIHLGPETRWAQGLNAANGHWETLYEDRLHLRVRVCGGAPSPFPFVRDPGRFKAIYRLWWVPKPPPLKQMVLTVQDNPPPRNSVLSTQGSVTVTAKDLVTGAALNGTIDLVSPDGTKFPGTTGVPLKYTCIQRISGRPVRLFCSGTVTVPGYGSETFRTTLPR